VNPRNKSQKKSLGDRSGKRAKQRVSMLPGQTKGGDVGKKPLAGKSTKPGTQVEKGKGKKKEGKHPLQKCRKKVQREDNRGRKGNPT